MTARASFAPSIVLIVLLAIAGAARTVGQDDGDRSTTAVWWPDWLFDRGDRGTTPGPGIIQLTEDERDGKLVGDCADDQSPAGAGAGARCHDLRVRCRKSR